MTRYRKDRLQVIVSNLLDTTYRHPCPWCAGRHSLAVFTQNAWEDGVGSSCSVACGLCGFTWREALVYDIDEGRSKMVVEVQKDGRKQCKPARTS